MPKAAVIVLADTERHADLARVTNALETVKEFQEAGDDVRLIFDGAGTQWPVKLQQDDHPLHELYQAVEGSVAGVCSFCAGAFDVAEAVEDIDLTTLDTFDGHPSIRDLVADDYTVLTF